MICDQVALQIPLYCYGEVTPDMEEFIESHLADCAKCRAELARHRHFLDSLDRREDMGELTLLADCRSDLRAALRGEASPARAGWMESLRRIAGFRIPFQVPAGALALVALGFFGARLTPERFGGMKAGLAEPMFSSVRSVEPGASGDVQISVDEVRRHVVSGSLREPRIRDLLLTALREESNPGVRVESIGMLRNGEDSAKVREALLDAVTKDPNAGVRLKALEGLQQYAGDANVRRVLAGVLLKDDNPGVRVQAIDLLTAHHDDSIVGVLQDVVQREDNSYVRTRCSKLLGEMKASVGTY